MPITLVETPTCCKLSFSKVNHHLEITKNIRHNPDSVMKAVRLSAALSEQNKLKVRPEFAQLQGMADVLGCQLLHYCEQLPMASEANGGTVVSVPKVYKCLTWGSVQECMQYLFRRMIENSGATERMRDSLSSYRHELKVRMLRSITLSPNRRD